MIQLAVDMSKKDIAPFDNTPRCTKAENDLRINSIIQLKLKGYTRSEIIEYAGKKWGIKRSQCDNLISVATNRILESNSMNISETMSVILANYWKQYRDASDSRNGQLCLMVLKEIAKLKGLDQITVNHVHHKPEDYDDLDDDAIEAELARKDE